MKKLFILLVPLLLVSCMSLPEPENDNSILIVINASLNNSWPDVYKSAHLFLDTNKKERIGLNSGLNYIEGLETGLITLKRVYVEYEGGKEISIPVDKSLYIQPSTIIIISKKFIFEVYIEKTTSMYTLFSVRASIDPVSSSGMDLIVKEIEESKSYDLWKNGYSIE